TCPERLPSPAATAWDCPRTWLRGTSQRVPKVTIHAPAHASGRLRATPVRRGKPVGVGASLRRTRKPGGLSPSPPPRRSATRATRSGRALAPTQRIAAPPGRTSGRHHSAATGGDASALATATPYS